MLNTTSFIINSRKSPIERGRFGQLGKEVEGGDSEVGEKEEGDEGGDESGNGGGDGGGNGSGDGGDDGKEGEQEEEKEGGEQEEAKEGGEQEDGSARRIKTSYCGLPPTPYSVVGCCCCCCCCC